MSQSDIDYCEKFLKDVDDYEIRISDNANALPVETTVGMWNSAKKRYDTVKFTNSMAGHLGNAVKLFKDDKEHYADHLREWIDKMKMANLVVPYRLNGQVKYLQKDAEDLKAKIVDRERRIHDLEDEGHAKDNRIRYLENILVKNNVTFGTEFSGVG